MAELKIDGTTLDTIGVRYKGNSTFEFADVINKYAIKLDINEFVKGQKYDGINKINLNNNLLDPSGLRAKLSFDIMKRMNIISPRVAYAKVTVNGSYRGLYTMVEQIDKTFVKSSNFDPDNTGYLHKSFGFTVGDLSPSDNGRDLSDESLLLNIPLKTKKSTKNYQPIRNFVLAARNATDEEFANDINNTFDLDSFIKQQALNMILSDRDHYCTANVNFYMYQNPLDNKWYMIPWDYDLAFAAISGSLITEIANYPLFYKEYCYLTQRMMNIPSLKTKYREALCEIINTGMDSTWINNRITTLGNLIGAEIENDPYFWDISDYNFYLDNPYPINTPGTGLEGTVLSGIRDFVNKRYDQVVDDLAAYDFSCSLTLNVDDTSLELTNIDGIYPNPTNDFIYLKGNDIKVGDISIYSMLGQNMNISSIKRIDNNTTQIDLSTLSLGMYFIKTKTTTSKVYKN
ncbi:CotH kinase family protein [Aquimarina sp. ERC-38]|uniref:CotH kinase family protein n=1 Tax=Aquimarina sp. ERC-38 TaxID=2949996 RepID=UPI0022476FAF|nr:CotH kinase family protein [Aquimarina sp. ERC-38]UZO79772.1 CotH kinase family protein [Aquimarina sp. ERC-38]